MGDGVTETDVKASYASGVLHIRVPKKEAQKLPEKNTILIEG
ncbi:MAG: Hsp20 family protein [Candidatus Ventricola sp.]